MGPGLEFVRCLCSAWWWSTSHLLPVECPQLEGMGGQMSSFLGKVTVLDSWMFVTPSLCILPLFTGKNKRVGKQLASQKILQLLHPHVKNWGSLLRMYGRESSKMVKQVTGLPSQPWSTCLGSHCHRDRVKQLCSCSWPPFLGSLLGYFCDFVVGGWGGSSCPRGLGLALAVWRGDWSSRSAGGECCQP